MYLVEVCMSGHTTKLLGFILSPTVAMAVPKKCFLHYLIVFFSFLLISFHTLKALPSCS